MYTEVHCLIAFNREQWETTQMSVRGVGKFWDLCTVRSWADVGKNEDVLCKAVESMEERRPGFLVISGCGNGKHHGARASTLYNSDHTEYKVSGAPKICLTGGVWVCFHFLFYVYVT